MSKKSRNPFHRFLLCTALIAAFSVQLHAQEKPLPAFEMKVGLGAGFLQGDLLKDYKAMLTPTPDKVQLIVIPADIRFYFMKYLGILANGDCFGLSQAQSGQSASLNIYTWQLIRAGAVLRIPIAEDYSINLCGGANYMFYNLADGFKNLFPAGTIFWKGPAKGFGWFGAFEVRQKINDKFFVSGSVILDKVNMKFDDAQASMNGFHANLVVSAGFCI